MAPPSELDDLLALVQPPASDPKPTSSTDASLPAGLEGLDLSALTPSDLALLGPLMKLLDLSPADVAALASPGDGDEAAAEEEDDEDGDDDDDAGVDAAMRAELERLDEAERAAGSLEGNLDRLLARLSGLEDEVNDGPAADAEQAGGAEPAEGQ